MDLSRDNKLYSTTKNFRKQILDFDTPNHFKDIFFPATEDSIIYVEKDSEIAKDITQEEINDLKGLTWLEPKDIFGNSKYKIYDKLEINDIHQGILGDCYFLSSVSALAEYPERFNKIFISKEVTKNGCLAVQFYLHGKPKIITIDDLFPCRKNRNKWTFAFASSGENELWVSILEKAWAKVCGSYAQTIAGLPSEALGTLTEAPTISYIHKRLGKEKIWEELLSADRNNFIICTNSTDETAAKDLGIVQSHAYTFIGCKEVDGIKFVQLRNPWGSFEWKGDYSDNSNKWTDRLKKELGFVNSNDGVFFMTFEDFFKYFPYTFSCKYYDNFYYQYKKLKPVEPTSMMCAKFHIYENTTIFIGLHQKTTRFYKKIRGYKINFGRIIVARYNKNAPMGERYELVGSEFACHEKLYVSLEKCISGEYHIFAQVNWNFNEKCSFVISTYASQSTPLEVLSPNEIPNNYLSEILGSFVKTKKKSNITSDINLHYSIEDNHTGYFITSYENINLKQTIYLSFEATCNQYVKLVSKHLGYRDMDRKVDVIGFYIPPGTSKTILFEVNDLYKSDMKIGKYHFDLLPNYVKADDDPVKFYLSKHLEFLEKEQISKDCLYMEFHENIFVYIIFMNNGELNYNLNFSFNQLVNLRQTTPDENINVAILRSHSFVYVKLEVNDIKLEYDVKISYKLKAF